MTMTEAATQDEPAGTSFTVTGPNGGTVIRNPANGATGTPCFYKTDYRGDPHEFGAYGDGKAHGGNGDTVAIQNWLGAYGMVTDPAATNPPANFGPWKATVPGTYLVYQPLFCPPNATIQGDENLTNNGNGMTHNPRIEFKASNDFSGTSYQSSYTTSTYVATQAVIGALGYCRLSGIAVTGNGFYSQSTNASTTSGSNQITVGTVSPDLQIGNAVSDTSGFIPDETTVVAPLPTGGCPCIVYISQNATGTAASSDTINFYGPDAVEVLGNRLTVDGFSLLQKGHYDLFCGVAQGLGQDGVSIKDSSFQDALLDDIHIPGPCSNVRLIGNIVAGAGRDGILFGATEGTIADGVIEESNNAGLHLMGASRMSVTGMHIQGNGTNVSGTATGGASTAGILIEQAHTISICGNHLEGNGGDFPNSSQIYFRQETGAVIDNVILCGNAYEVQSQGSSLDVFPSYVYDADSQVALTNTHIYETAGRPVISVFSPNAQPLLSSLVVPQFTNNQISGLTLSNDTGTPDAKIDIAGGGGADSTNSTLIQIPSSGCVVDFTASGAGGIDTGSGQPNATYFIFAIAPVAGTQTSAPVTPPCIASRSLVPAFTDTSFSNSGYQIAAVAGFSPTDNIVYNVSAINGAIAGDAIWDTAGGLPGGTTIHGFSANATATVTVAVGLTGPLTTIPVVSVAGVKYGMAVVDGGMNNCFPSNTVVTGISTSPMQITVSAATCSEPAGTSINLYGAQQINLSQTPTASNGQANLRIAGGYYRLIGAVMTDSSSHLVGFTQDGDTFYLANSVEDIDTTICAPINSSAKLCGLSVPCGRTAACVGGQGVQVVALGRILGGAGASSQMLLSSPDQSDQPPTRFVTAAPGYTTLNSTGDTAFPFRLHTDLNRSTVTSMGSVRVRVNYTTGTLVYEVTDGWVFHR